MWLATAEELCLNLSGTGILPVRFVRPKRPLHRQDACATVPDAVKRDSMPPEYDEEWR